MKPLYDVPVARIAQTHLDACDGWAILVDCFGAAEAADFFRQNVSYVPRVFPWYVSDGRGVG